MQQRWSYKFWKDQLSPKGHKWLGGIVSKVKKNPGELAWMHQMGQPEDSSLSLAYNPSWDHKMKCYLQLVNIWMVQITKPKTKCSNPKSDFSDSTKMSRTSWKYDFWQNLLSSEAHKHQLQWLYHYDIFFIIHINQCPQQQQYISFYHRRFTQGKYRPNYKYLDWD